jgi:hypothetical protein
MPSEPIKFPFTPRYNDENSALVVQRNLEYLRDQIAQMFSTGGGGNGGSGMEEVFEGPTAPSPRGEFVLWIDTDEPSPGTGGGSTTYTFSQATPSAIWVIPHGLDRQPSVTVVDTGESVVIPSVHYDSPDQITVSFGSPTSGKAYLN